VSNKILRYGLYSFIALTAFGAGVWVKSFRNPPEVSAADAVYAITLPDLENKPQQLNQWRGKVLVVNFWATWCAPCVEEIPMFIKVQDKHLGKGLQFIGISIDKADKTADFARKFGINYPSLIGTIDTIEISRQAGNTRRVLPYTVILDRKGQVAATGLGGLTEEKLEAIINPLL
jgi:thiol-disulfide isomerase/thioredoxin